MPSSHNAWNTATLKQLADVTRNNQFAFDKVAEEMRSFVTESGDATINTADVTADECRRQFSSCYLGFEEGEATAPAPAECDARSIVARSVDAFLATDYTFDGAMQFAEKLQADSYAQQEEIFTRVFQALESEVCTKEDGTLVKSSAGAGDLSNIAPDVLAAWNHRKAKTEAEKARKLKLQQETEEKAALEAQRLRLMRRFDADSEDAQGVDPLSQPSNINAYNLRQVLGAVGVGGGSSSADHKMGKSSASSAAATLSVADAQQMQVAALEDKLDSMEPTAEDVYLERHFKMTDFVNSNEFEAILESLEKELASQADNKANNSNNNSNDSSSAIDEHDNGGAGGESSELGEILKYLDAVSASDEKDEGAADINSDPLILNLTNMTAVRKAVSTAEMASSSNSRGGSSSSSSSSSSHSSALPPPPPADHMGSGKASSISSSSAATPALPAPPASAPVPARAEKPPTPNSATKAKPAASSNRKVIETILDDDDSDEDDNADSSVKRHNHRRNWKSSRDKLKGNQPQNMPPTAAATASTAQSWGAGGAETDNTAAGLLLKQRQEKYNPYTSSQYFQYGATVLSSQKQELLREVEAEELRRATEGGGREGAASVGGGDTSEVNNESESETDSDDEGGEAIFHSPTKGVASLLKQPPADHVARAAAASASAACSAEVVAVVEAEEEEEVAVQVVVVDEDEDEEEEEETVVVIDDEDEEEGENTVQDENSASPTKNDAFLTAKTAATTATTGIFSSVRGGSNKSATSVAPAATGILGQRRGAGASNSCAARAGGVQSSEPAEL